MKDFENDLIYYPNPDPVKEPRFILKSVDELEKSTKYSVTCNGTERVVYHTDSFDYPDRCANIHRDRAVHILWQALLPGVFGQAVSDKSPKSEACCFQS